MLCEEVLACLVGVRQTAYEQIPTDASADYIDSVRCSFLFLVLSFCSWRSLSIFLIFTCVFLAITKDGSGSNPSSMSLLHFLVKAGIRSTIILFLVYLSFPAPHGSLYPFYTSVTELCKLLCTLTYLLVGTFCISWYLHSTPIPSPISKACTRNSSFSIYNHFFKFGNCLSFVVMLFSTLTTSISLLSVILIKLIKCTLISNRFIFKIVLRNPIKI